MGNSLIDIKETPRSYVHAKHYVPETSLIIARARAKVQDLKGENVYVFTLTIYAFSVILFLFIFKIICV